MLATLRSVLGRHLPTLRQHVRRRRRAQALVEFAITVPVMVTILLFAMYFYEIIQIKLKTQEVARYAAWEFTGYPLHDYDKDRAQGFGDAKNDIMGDISERYVNLKSGDRGQQNKWLMVSWSPPRVRLRDENEPKIPGGGTVNTVFTILGYVVDVWSALAFTHPNPVLYSMMAIYMADNHLIFGARGSRFNPPGKWAFNKKGYAKVTVTVAYQNLLIPRYFMDSGTSSWYSVEHFAHRSGRYMRFEEKAALVADSWRLHYGDDIKGPRDQGANTNAPYYKQVDRMAFVSKTVRNVVKAWAMLVEIPMTALSLATTQPPLSMNELTETTLVSMAYKNGGGKVTIREDWGDASYDTSPLPPNSEYQKTLDKRGEHYMGCKDPEKLGCFDSLSQDNPFGDFVDPPESNP